MWTDFDEKKGTLSIRRTLHTKEGGGYYVGETKTGTGRRTIKLPPSTVQLLKERKKSYHTMDIPQSHSSGRPHHAQQRVSPHEKAAGRSGTS